MIQKTFSKLKRPINGLTAVLLGLASAAPILLNSSQAYAGQISSRSIELSSAAVSATGVSYLVSFKPSVTTNIGGIVVDFCADSPILGSATCTYPSAFDLGSTPSVSGLSGFSTSTGSWAATSSAGGAQGGAGAGKSQILIYTNATAQTPTGTGTAISFTINSVANTSTVGSFYARIYTFDTQAHTNTAGTGYGSISGTTRPTSFTGVNDSGGIALSTANTIGITATVQETLTFCVSKAAPASGCTSTTAPTLVLGNGATPSILDTTKRADGAFTQITSNAASGVIVRMNAFKSDGTVPSCAGLSRDNGATCPIAAVGAFGAIGTGSALFGLNVQNGTGGTGTVTADPDYGTTATSYGMNDANVRSTYGDPIESSSAATVDVNSALSFAAAAGATTPAGVYSTNESLVATGTF